MKTGVCEEEQEGAEDLQQYLYEMQLWGLNNEIETKSSSTESSSTKQTESSYIW